MTTYNERLAIVMESLDSVGIEPGEALLRDQFSPERWAILREKLARAALAVIDAEPVPEIVPNQRGIVAP